ncbi:MAG: M64 family metallopeptidase [Bacteroidota bacterium]
MKTKIILTLLLIPLLVKAQMVSFNDFFDDKTMRIDYFHIGDSSTEIITIDFIYKYGTWAGSTKHLIDNFNNGAYYYKIYDLNSENLIYSKGFDSYFKEYQMTDEASKGIKRTFHESAIIPYPKNKIKFVIEKRGKKNILNEVFSTVIDPSDLYIIKDPVIDVSVTAIESYKSGNPHNKVDVVIIGDGYSAGEFKKFEHDLKRFTKVLLAQEPFKKHKDKFNIYGVYKASMDSGIDEPGANVYKNTVLNTTYYTMGSERYILTEENKTLRKLAAHVPYDAILIMVNGSRYGGGGLYNTYCTFVADNQFCDYLLLHEFGHSFAGLADEYYTSETAYNDMYPVGIEPVEPNITRLYDKNNLKWKNVLSHGIEIPTPWEKEEFDKTDFEWQKVRREMNSRIAGMKRNKEPIEKVKATQDEYDIKDRARSQEVDRYLKASKFAGKVGAFEGAGYNAKGMYRSMLDCIMFTKGAKPFCKVCEEHISKVIMHYTE